MWNDNVGQWQETSTSGHWVGKNINPQERRKNEKGKSTRYMGENIYC